MKKSLDQLVVERGLAPTRAKAQALILAGEILVNGEPATKAGHPFPEDAAITPASTGLRCVSRGGLKLEGALEDFGVDPAGWVCLDVGASTGGFTDCLLQKGALKVFTLDVGKGQLDPKLRNDPQVVWRESFHAKELTPEILGEPVDLAVVDVSFISLRSVLPFVLPCLKPGGLLLALVKPQFEASPRDLEKGVLRDEDTRLGVIRDLKEWATAHPDLTDLRTSDSRLRGPKGNRECFLLARRRFSAQISGPDLK